jgi:hypothetical protein
VIVARRRAPVWIAALLALPCASPAAAQLTEAGTAVRPPGWSLTPAIGVSQLWDDNPGLASEATRSGDFVTAVQPSLTLGFRGKRTTLHTDYNGSFEYYRRVRDQDRRDHRVTFDLSHRLTPHVHVYVRDQALHSPTTADAVALGPTTLRRRTTRMNNFRSGFDAMLGARTTISGVYVTEWIDFPADDDTLVPAPLLQGGYSHGGTGEVRHRLTPRWTVGADYVLQRATVGRGAETFEVQSALGVTEFALSPALSATFGYGHSWLAAGDAFGPRGGAAFNMGLTWNARRLSGTVGYRRAFLPSFGFGGTFQNEEFSATLAAQVARHVRWKGGVALSDADPLRPIDATLRSISAHTSLGVLLKRYLRLEVFGVHVFQDSGLAGGRVDRTRAGVQATVSGVMRAR